MRYDMSQDSRALQARIRAGLKPNKNSQNSLAVALRNWPGTTQGMVTMAHCLPYLTPVADDVYSYTSFAQEAGRENAGHPRTKTKLTLDEGLSGSAALGIIKMVKSSKNPSERFFRVQPLRMAALIELVTLTEGIGFKGDCNTVRGCLIWAHHHKLKKVSEHDVMYIPALAAILGVTASGLRSAISFPTGLHRFYFINDEARLYLKNDEKTQAISKAWYDFFVSTRRWIKEPF